MQVAEARADALILEVRGAFDLHIADRLRQPLFEGLALICPDAPHPSLIPLRQSGLDEVIQIFPSREVFEAFIGNLEGGTGKSDVWKVLSNGDLVERSMNQGAP